MPIRKMVRKKSQIGIVIYDDDHNHIKFVTDVICQTFGYHPTQALQCANMIHDKGSYQVKQVDSKEVAETYRNILINAGLIVRIIPL